MVAAAAAGHVAAAAAVPNPSQPTFVPHLSYMESQFATHALLLEQQSRIKTLEAELAAAHVELMRLRSNVHPPCDPSARSAGDTATATASAPLPSNGRRAAMDDAKKASSRYWTPEEHARFLEGLELYGQKDIKAISRHVGTRSATQVRTHAQKYYLRIERERAKAEGIALHPSASRDRRSTHKGRPRSRGSGADRGSLSTESVAEPGSRNDMNGSCSSGDGTDGGTHGPTDHSAHATTPTHSSGNGGSEAKSNDIDTSNVKMDLYQQQRDVRHVQSHTDKRSRSKQSRTTRKAGKGSPPIRQTETAPQQREQSYVTSKGNISEKSDRAFAAQVRGKLQRVCRNATGEDNDDGKKVAKGESSIVRTEGCDKRNDVYGKKYRSDGTMAEAVDQNVDQAVSQVVVQTADQVANKAGKGNVKGNIKQLSTMDGKGASSPEEEVGVKEELREVVDDVVDEIGRSDIGSGNINNGDISNGDVSNGDISNGDISNGDISNGDIGSGGIGSGGIDNVGIDNGDTENGAIDHGDDEIGNDGIGNGGIGEADKVGDDDKIGIDSVERKRVSEQDIGSVKAKKRAKVEMGASTGEGDSKVSTLILSTSGAGMSGVVVGNQLPPRVEKAGGLFENGGSMSNLRSLLQMPGLENGASGNKPPTLKRNESSNSVLADLSKNMGGMLSRSNSFMLGGKGVTRSNSILSLLSGIPTALRESPSTDRLLGLDGVDDQKVMMMASLKHGNGSGVGVGIGVGVGVGAVGVAASNGTSLGDRSFSFGQLNHMGVDDLEDAGAVALSLPDDHKWNDG